jgi:hypothetical protein
MRWCALGSGKNKTHTQQCKIDSTYTTVIHSPNNEEWLFWMQCFLEKVKLPFDSEIP